MNKGVKYLLGKNKIDVISGFATLAGDGKIDVKPSVDMDGNKIGKALSVTAKHIIIATGARPRELPFMKIDGKKIISSTEALTQTKRPARLVICGAGAIGVEFAYFYHNMGTEVVLVELLDRPIIGGTYTWFSILRTLILSKADMLVDIPGIWAEIRCSSCSKNIS